MFRFCLRCEEIMSATNDLPGETEDVSGDDSLANTPVFWNELTLELKRSISPPTRGSRRLCPVYSRCLVSVALPGPVESFSCSSFALICCGRTTVLAFVFLLRFKLTGLEDVS